MLLRVAQVRQELKYKKEKGRLVVGRLGRHKGKNRSWEPVHGSAWTGRRGEGRTGAAVSGWGS